MATALAIGLPVEPARTKHDDWRVTQDALTELQTWLTTKETLTMAVHDVEREVVERGREILRRAMQAHLNARGNGDVGTSVEVQEEDRNALMFTHRRQADRSLFTAFGPVEVQRLAYSLPGHSGLCPVDSILQMPIRRYSYEVQRHMAREAVRGPYGEAVKTLAAYTGRTVSKRTVEDVVMDVSMDFDAFYEQRTLPPPEQTSGIVVGAVDCKGVCIIKEEPPRQLAGAPAERQTGVKRMATVGTVYTVAPRPRTPEEVVESLFKERPKLAVAKPTTSQNRPEHKRLWASLEKTKDDIISAMAAEMERRDPGHSKKRAVVTDGERALQQRVTKLLPGVLLILDLLHVLERLWAVAIVFFGSGSSTKSQREEWVRKQTLRLLQGGVSEVVRGIRQSATKRALEGTDADTVRTAAAYLYANRTRMRYNDYLEQGLPIASGAVEGACKNLINDRMERSGMRWYEDSAEAMLRMRAVYLSGDYDTYWAFHIACEQARLREGRTWRAPNCVEKK
jgi:hypothetical protein